MDRTHCNQVRAALLLTCTDSRHPAHSPALPRHFLRCAECRALRTYLLYQLLPGADIPDDSCALCESDLAAYADIALDAGARAAAAAYPHVWWHLWACPECAEVFAQTVALSVAAASGALPPLPMLRAASALPHREIGRRPRLAAEAEAEDAQDG
ncbi:MAG: hypothetical protein HGB28_04705 [Oscillochloris sp.]|nr:hypothetical protein [Oscillochloris sp.]